MSKWGNLPPRPSSSRVAASNELLRKVEAAKQEEKMQIAADGLMKLLALPPKPVEEAVPELDDVASLTPERKAVYDERVAALTKSWDKFKATRRPQLTSRDAINELFMIDTTPLALLMFGPQRVAMWEARYPGETSRDIFEISEVDDQCQATLGPVVPGETPCWICGMPIFWLKPDLVDGDKNGHSPECEHILPIAQAALFLQLYDKSNVASDLYHLEYAWSHKTCNQTKNDDVYFKHKRGTGAQSEMAILDPATNLPQPDDELYEKLLEKIYDSGRQDAVRSKSPGYTPHKRAASFVPDPYSFKDTLQDWIHFNYGKDKRSVGQWKAARVAEFRRRYAAIFEFIGGNSYTMSPELYILSLASAAAHIINRQDENRRPKKGARSIRRETLYGFIPSDSIVLAKDQPPPPPPAGPSAAASAAAAAGAGPEPSAAAGPEVDVFEQSFGPLPGHAIELLRPLSSLETLSGAAPYLVQIPYGSEPHDPASVGLPLGPLSTPEAVNINRPYGLLRFSNVRPGAPMPLPAPAAAGAPAGPADGVLANVTSPLPPRNQLPREAHNKVRLFESPHKAGRRTRRHTPSFLPYSRRRTHHAIRMSSRRHSPSGIAASF